MFTLKPVGVFAVVVTLMLASVARAVITDQPFPVFPISTVANHDQRFARIDGQYVAWTDVRYLGGPTSSNDVFAYDLGLGQQLTIATGNTQQDSPVISGNTIIWYQGGDLFGRNLSALPGGATFTVATSNKSAQALSGSTLVWHEFQGGHSVINGHDLAQPVGTNFSISGATAFDQDFPDVSGNVVVWMSENEPGDQGNIYGRNLTGGGVFPITTHSGKQLFPQISGNYVVWEDFRDGPSHIYAKDLTTNTEFLVSSLDSEQARPAIDGDLVVWMDDRNGLWDIYGRHLSGGTEFAITDTDDLSEGWPDVSGNTVVWETGIDTNIDYIYGAVVPEPSTVGILAIAVALSTTSRRRRLIA